jgi:hypothetical protein
MGLTQKLGTIPLAIFTDASNNIGIGGSPSGSYKFEVTGTGNFTGALRTASSSFPLDIYGTTNNYGLRINNVQAATLLLYSSNENSSSRNWGLYTNSEVYGDFDIRQSNAKNGDMTAGANSTSRLYIKNNGYIGINTTSPGASLPSGAGWTTAPSKTRILQINSTDGDANSALFIRQANNSTGLDLWSDNYYGDSYIDNRWDNSAGSILLRVRTAGTPITAMKIFGNGNITIGTNIVDTGFKFYMRSTAGMYLECGSTSSHTSLQVSDSGGNYVYFRVRGDGYLQSASTYSNTTASGANVSISSSGYFERSTSSIKYKKDVKDYDKGLAEVMAMRPVYYKGKGENDGDKQFAGLIAEEIDALGLNEFVQYADDQTPDALYYSNMVALLTKAIQEQQKQIEELKQLVK